MTAFSPQHLIPAGGAVTWAEPDPAKPGDGRLDSGLPVQTMAQTTGWARVRCSNGFETWLDARQLVPIPEMSSGAPATHRVGSGGARTRPRPEAADPPDQRLEPGLEVVELVRWGQWSFVRCANGWETWVDSSDLSAASRAGGEGDHLAIWVPIGGAALVILGSVLAWFSAAGASASAWDLPWVGLATRDTTDVNIDAGPLLLVVVLVGVAPLMKRALTRWVVGALGSFAALTALLGFWFYFDLPDPRPNLGVGLALTFIGALVMLAGAVVPRRAS